MSSPADYIINSTADRNGQTEPYPTVINDATLQVRPVVPADKEDMSDSGSKGCGCLSFRPKCLQVFNNPKMLLLALCWFAFIQGMVVSGVLLANITSIERQFGLSSSQASLIVSIYDISAGFVVLAIGYFGTVANKARLLTVSALIMTCATFIMAIPHFTVGEYQLGSEAAAAVCGVTSECKNESGNQNYLFVFLLGQLTEGIGGSILYCAALIFLDESVPVRQSPLYLGIFYAASALGPAVGYVIGGEFLTIYVDFDTVDREIEIGEDDPRWVGAWWLGLLIGTVGFFTVAMAMFGFPAELPGARAAKKERIELHYQHIEESELVAEGFGKNIKHLPRALWRLLTNPVYMLVVLVITIEAGIVQGISAFLPKFIQNQFRLPASSSGIITGLVVVPGAALGMFLSGVVVTRLKLRVKGMTIMCLIAGIICLPLMGAFYMPTCVQENIIGVNLRYTNPSRTLSEVSLKAQCNSDCGCSTHEYQPVCLVKRKLEYFSPCHAGCQWFNKENKTAHNCTCLEDNRLIDNVTRETLVDGNCEHHCQFVIPFAITLFLLALSAFMMTAPAISIVLRSVAEEHRSLAVSLKWFFERFIGLVPAPILYGAVIDRSCQVWQRSCDKEGSCWLYDTLQMSGGFFMITFICKVVVVLLLIAALVIQVHQRKSKKSLGTVPTASSGTLDTVAESSSTVATIAEPDITQATSTRL